MTVSDLKTNDIKIDAGDVQVDAYLAEPSTEGTYPGVIVIQEVFGVNDHIKDVTRRIANEGYIAVAPAIYQRQAPGFAVGYSEQKLAEGRKYKEQTKASELLNDIQASINCLKSLPNCQGERFGCIGFCFGGHVAYLAATLPDIQATASFYGAGIATNTPGGGEPIITRTKDIQGTLYAFFGKEDPLIPLEQVDQIEAELKKHNIPHRIFRYDGAEHGFFCDQRASYQPAAAQDSWERVQGLFQETLKQ
ncbi:MAG: carboxymethylenebutenolidase [Cyanobacteria bacterium SW_9_44_58]|nr:MAG: carboxymethylenebutenolidase [Cyanobacteria bacterium SW_9_44_58]